MRNFVRAFPFLLLPMLASCARHADPNAPLNSSVYHTPIKVACVGDSITLGHGLADNTYPEQLGRMLGHDYEVRNFGVSGATLLNKGDKPYEQQDLYKQSLAFEPDVVVIMLGTNDSKSQNWQYKGSFHKDYRLLVQEYQHLESHPRVWLVFPTPVFNGGKYGIREAPVDVELPLIASVAHSRRAGIVDMHGTMVDDGGMFPDGVHPDTAGATVMAKTIYQALTGKAYRGPSPVLEATTTP